MGNVKKIPLPGLAALTLAVVMLLSACAQNVPATPDGSRPNEYSAYLFSAANVLYYDYQYDRAEEVYRLALKFDPQSKEIRKALFNTLMNRVNYREIPLEYFAGYVDTLLARKDMDKLMLEQTYDIYIRYKEHKKAERVLNIYLKNYATPRAYTSLFYLEQTLYGKNRLSLLDKAYELGKSDPEFLNSLGLLYLAFNVEKAEKVWKQSAAIDTTFQAAGLLWGLYSVQNQVTKIRDLWQTLQQSGNRNKLEGVLESALDNGDISSLLLVSDLILASKDPQFILKLLQASWAAKDDVLFEASRSALQGIEFSSRETQLLTLYYALNGLRKNDAEDAVKHISALEGKTALDELLLIHRATALADSQQVEAPALDTIKSRLTATIKTATQEQLATPVKTYLLAAIDSLKTDGLIAVEDTLTYECLKWFYDNDRRTYDTYVNLGLHYHKTGQKDRQTAIIREALDEYPQDASLLNWLGYTYVLNNENLEEAEALIQRALQLSPDNPHYLDSLAWLYYTKGDYQTAIKLMEIPARLEQMPSEIAFHIAKIFLALGETEAAVEFLKLTVEIGDDPVFSKQALELLDSVFTE